MFSDHTRLEERVLMYIVVALTEILVLETSTAWSCWREHRYRTQSSDNSGLSERNVHVVENPGRKSVINQQNTTSTNQSTDGIIISTYLIHSKPSDEQALHEILVDEMLASVTHCLLYNYHSILASPNWKLNLVIPTCVIIQYRCDSLHIFVNKQLHCS